LAEAPIPSGCIGGAGGLASVRWQSDPTTVVARSASQLQYASQKQQHHFFSVLVGIASWGTSLSSAGSVWPMIHGPYRTQGLHGAHPAPAITVTRSLEPFNCWERMDGEWMGCGCGYQPWYDMAGQSAPDSVWGALRGAACDINSRRVGRPEWTTRRGEAVRSAVLACMPKLNVGWSPQPGGAGGGGERRWDEHFRALAHHLISSGGGC